MKLDKIGTQMDREKYIIELLEQILKVSYLNATTYGDGIVRHHAFLDKAHEFMEDNEI